MIWGYPYEGKHPYVEYFWGDLILVEWSLTYRVKKLRDRTKDNSNGLRVYQQKSSRPLGKFLQGKEIQDGRGGKGSFTPRPSQWFQMNGFLFFANGCFGADSSRVSISIP